MKNYTINLFTIAFFIMMCNSVEVLANKTKMYDGYVFLETGEKIFGKIHMLSLIENQVKLKITLQDDKTIQTYKPEDVKSYAFQVDVWNVKSKTYKNEWITYTKKEVERAPLPFGKKNILINELIRGKISYYTCYYQSNSDIDDPIKQSFYIEKSNAFVIINSENYEEILRDMTYDYPELSSEIGKKNYNYSHIEAIINQYNTYILDYGEEEILTQKN